MNGSIVLIPYDCGQEFYPGGESNETYLPVFVETNDEDLAIMAVAYAACVDYSYVAFPSTWQTAQEWEEKKYSGTLKSPTVDLPYTEAAVTIPEPGDCFCCGSLKDYTVYSLEEFRKSLKISEDGYILWALEKDEDLWDQFNNWSTRILNYELISKSTENSIDTQEIILVDTKKPEKSIIGNITLFNSEFEWLD